MQLNFKIIISIFILLIAGFVNKDSYAQIQAGIHFGSGISGLNTTPFINQTSVHTYSTGLSFRYHKAKDHAGFQANLLFQNPGWHENSDTSEYLTKLKKFTFDLNTIVLLGKNNLKFMISAGPFLSKIFDNNNILHTGNPYFVYEKDKDNSFIYGISFALGLQYHFNKSFLLLDLKAYSSMSPLFASNIDNPFENAWQQQLMLGLSWYLEL